VTCAGEIEFDPPAVAVVRQRIPVGVAWLRTLYPAFQASVTLQIG